jgi:hypothetical protein
MLCIGTHSRIMAPGCWLKHGNDTLLIRIEHISVAAWALGRISSCTCAKSAQLRRMLTRAAHRAVFPWGNGRIAKTHGFGVQYVITIGASRIEATNKFQAMTGQTARHFRTSFRPRATPRDRSEQN